MLDCGRSFRLQVPTSWRPRAPWESVHPSPRRRGHWLAALRFRGLCIETTVRRVVYSMTIERAPQPLRPPPGNATFGDFYQREPDGQVRRAVLLLGSNDVANDVVHDAFIAVFRRWESLDEPRAYLHMVVLNGCRGVHRQRARHRRSLVRLVERDTGEPDPRTPRRRACVASLQPTRRCRVALLRRSHE